MNDFIHGRHIEKGTNKEQLAQQNVRRHTLGFCGKRSGNFKWIPAQRLYTCTLNGQEAKEQEAIGKGPR